MSEAPKGHEGEAAGFSAADEFAFLARDENWDGKLSREEFEANRTDEDRRLDPTAFDRYDADGSGEISKEEFMDGLLRDRLRSLRHAADAEREADRRPEPMMRPDDPLVRADDALED